MNITKEEWATWIKQEEGWWGLKCTQNMPGYYTRSCIEEMVSSISDTNDWSQQPVIKLMIIETNWETEITLGVLA